jgi:hypothetical protein
VVASLISGVLTGMVDGQDAVTLSSGLVNVNVYNSLATDLYNLQLSAGSSTNTTSGPISSLQLPASGLDSCGSSESGYARLSVTQWASSPYINATGLKTPLLRVASSPANHNSGGAGGRVANSSFTLTLAYSVVQDLSRSTDGINNVTYTPDCVLYSGDGLSSTCGCDLITFDNTSASFRCPLLTGLCGVTTPSLER